MICEVVSSSETASDIIKVVCKDAGWSVCAYSAECPETWKQFPPWTLRLASLRHENLIVNKIAVVTLISIVKASATKNNIWEYLGV